MRVPILCDSTAGRINRCRNPPARAAASRQNRVRRSSVARSGPSPSAAAIEVSSAEPGIDWDNLGFGLDNVCPTMYMATYDLERGWQGDTTAYGSISMMPSAQVLNYGQSIFEGMKALRSCKGRTVLFRPTENAARMSRGAQRMCMPPVPESLFVEAVSSVVRSNAAWVPPEGKGSMYLRPLLLGTGPILGLGPAPSYTFLCFGAAVGAYFKGGQLTPIDLAVEKNFHRAAPKGGMGGTKAAGNYSPVLLAQLQRKREGFSDIVYLDAATDNYIEEVSSCNIFVLKDRHIKTPPLNGTILPGITRKSIIQLAQDAEFTVEEAPVSVQEAMEADEVFTSGTAVVVSPVGSLTHDGERRQYGMPGEPTPVALQLYESLTALQTERIEDPYDWVYPVDV